MRGNVVAGPLVAGNNLRVAAYRADGTLLVEGRVNTDGTFSFDIPSGFTGPVLVRATDAAPQPDYDDEATQQATAAAARATSRWQRGSPSSCRRWPPWLLGGQATVAGTVCDVWNNDHTRATLYVNSAVSLICP